MADSRQITRFGKFGLRFADGLRITVLQQTLINALIDEHGIFTGKTIQKFRRFIQPALVLKHHCFIGRGESAFPERS